MLRTRDGSDAVTVLAGGDPDRERHLAIYNRQAMVMDRIHDRPKADAEETRIAGYLDAGQLSARAEALRAEQRLLEPGKPPRSGS